MSGINIMLMLAMLAMLISYLPINDIMNHYQNDYSNTTLVDNRNNICESCNTIDEHIEIPCFSEEVFDFYNDNMTCKIYYEVCEKIPCLEMNTTFCYDCVDINFKGSTIRITKKIYLSTIAIILIYLLVPYRRKEELEHEATIPEIFSDTIVNNDTEEDMERHTI